ncbi:unnamed protein product [Malus baccata var. baccata]
MIHQFINFVIRPPRAEYNPDQYLWERDFTLAGRAYKRQDLEASMATSYRLSEHSCFRLAAIGCRADANEAAVMLLPSNITVFTLDFSGSGLSEVCNFFFPAQRYDLKIVVSYLRSKKQISRIGLWGRSMGAVTCLLYGAEDPSIAGMVLDSAFSSLESGDGIEDMEMLNFSCILGGMVKMAVQYMRRIIEKKAKFDIMDLNCLQVATKTFIPALFGHAKDDKFIQTHHSDIIYKSYAVLPSNKYIFDALQGDKNIIHFDGDHNSSRPQFYYDSVSIFFYSVLHPLQTSSHSCKLDKYYGLGDLKIGAGLDEGLVYEIITGVHSAGTDVASSSSAPPAISTTKCVGKLLYEFAPATTAVDSVNDEADTLNSHKPSHLEEQTNGENVECCSYTSSNRESWGRCSSLGGSDEESSADCTAAGSSHQKNLKVFAMPLRCIQQKSSELRKEEKKKKKVLIAPKKTKSEKFEKSEALSKRLRLCILKRVKNCRHPT